MQEYEVRILEVKEVSLYTYKVTVEKPKEYTFVPGQFANISLTGDSQSKRGSFCFTGLTEVSNLEFIIKLYNHSDSLKKGIVSLKMGSSIKISSPQGNLQYRGKGVFIAAGTGITPVIAILRNLKKRKDLAGNMLLYSNKTMADVLFDDQFIEMLGNDYIKLFTKQQYDGYYFGRINKNFLRMVLVDFMRYFYVCGSINFVQDILSILKEFKIPSEYIIFEDAIINNSVREDKNEDIVNIK